MFVFNNSCSPNSSFISNGGIISSHERLIEFADTEAEKKMWRRHAVAGIYLCYGVAAQPSMFLHLLGSFLLPYNEKAFFCLHSKLASSRGLCT